MTKLEHAFAEAAKLSPSEQDALAELILQELTSERRWAEAFEGLPDHIRRQARQAYKLFQQDPYHPGLRFKQIHPSKPIVSVRAGLGYRALGIRTYHRR